MLACTLVYGYLPLYFRASSKKLHQYVGLYPGLRLFTSLFQSQPQDTTPICWLVPWSMVIYLSISEAAAIHYTNMLACTLVYGYLPLYFRASSKKLHQYVGLCPGLWLFTSLSISEPAARNYTNMLACALVYGYLPLYFRGSSNTLHQYVGLCPDLWLFTSLFQRQQQETTPICWLVPWSMVIYLSISEPVARNYTNMLACALVYGYLPLYFRASSKKLHQYVGLCPGLWLFTSLFQSQ